MTMQITGLVCYCLHHVLFGQDSWETVGKKKSVGKEGVTAETKERRVDKEGRGRGGPNRRGRGASRFQEGV